MLRVLVPCLLVLALLPVSAGASGFSPPADVAPTAADLYPPAVAVGEGGHVAVAWRGWDARTHRRLMRARIGGTAATLGPVQTLAGPALDDPQLAVSPSGRVVLCGTPTTPQGDPRDGVGCAVASARSARLGPIRVRHRSLRLGALLAAEGGFVVATLTRGAELRQALVDTRGNLHDVRRLGRMRGERRPRSAVGPDGEVVTVWTDEERQVVAHTWTRYGSQPPGPVVVAPPGDRAVTRVSGGRAVTVTFDRPNFPGRDSRAVTVVRGVGGVFGAPFVVEEPVTESNVQRYGLADSDGTADPFVVEQAGEQLGGDCTQLLRGEVRAGTVRSGTLGPLERLSADGQIAAGLSTGVLADGTAIAVWGNFDSGREEAVLEYALRGPGGTFAPGVPLPARGDPRLLQLRASGAHAVLAWSQAGRVKLAELRDAGPFAAVARRPSRPEAPCESA